MGEWIPVVVPNEGLWVFIEQQQQSVIDKRLVCIFRNSLPRTRQSLQRDGSVDF